MLETYCQQTQRSKTEVLRELIRCLEVSKPLPSSKPSATVPEAAVNGDGAGVAVPFQVSARNLFRGSITKLFKDGVNTEVTLEIAPHVEITSVITTSSAQRLGLKVGKVVFAMIKSSNVMIAVSDSLEFFAEGPLA
ncbi:MAG: molybdopterin-binding protein [Spirulina sp.]